MAGLVGGYMARRQEPSLLCSFSNYTTSEALAADCEPSEWTGQEVGRGRGWREGYSARRTEWEAKEETSRWGFC